MVLGMGLGRIWVARAQDQQPVSVSAKLADQLPPIVEIAEKMNPTVVFVENTSYVRNRSSRYNSMPDDFWDYFFGSPQQPNRRQQEGGGETPVLGGGSGFFISHDGEILTNAHVVEGLRGSENPIIKVKTADGNEYPAVVLGRDTSLDVALLKIDIRNAPYVKLGDSDTTKVGEWVVAIGNPLGLEHTVTQGIISAKGRRGQALGDSNLVADFLQTDAAINHGNSGGPLINLRGEVVGINTAIRADGQNIGFAVPIVPVKNILRDLRAGKPISRGWLGITPQTLNNELQEGLGINVSEGALVDAVAKASPAEKAGLRRLDVITAVDGKPIKNSNELITTISSHREGDTVKLDIIRGGRKQVITVTLGDRASMDGETAPGARPPVSGDGLREEGGSVDLEKTYGFQVEALNTQNRRNYRVPEQVTGVVITKVLPRTSASGKGLSEGVVINGVGTKEIKALDEFRSEIQKQAGKTILLSIRQRSGRGGDGFSEPMAIAIPVTPSSASFR
jgi:serine protease Do